MNISVLDSSGGIAEHSTVGEISGALVAVPKYSLDGVDCEVVWVVVVFLASNVILVEVEVWDVTDVSSSLIILIRTIFETLFVRL